MASGVSAGSSRRRSQPSFACGSLVGQVGARAVADVEQVGQHPRGSALLAGTEQGGDRDVQKLTEEIEQGRFDRRDHIVGAQVDLVRLPQQGGLGFVGDLMDGGLASRLAGAGQ